MRDTGKDGCQRHGHLPFILAARRRAAPAFYPLARTSNPFAWHAQGAPATPVYMNLQLPAMHSRAVTAALVGSCPAFSPLPAHVETTRQAVVFFCIAPRSRVLPIKKRNALRCPDFPPSSASHDGNHTARTTAADCPAALFGLQRYKFFGENACVRKKLLNFAAANHNNLGAEMDLTASRRGV